MLECIFVAARVFGHEIIVSEEGWSGYYPVKVVRRSEELLHRARDIPPVVKKSGRDGKHEFSFLRYPDGVSPSS